MFINRRNQYFWNEYFSNYISTRASQKFCNIVVMWSTILATPETFAEVMKIMNHIGQWDDKLAWYSPSATHQICLYGSEHSLRIQSSCSPSKISWTIWSLYCNRLYLWYNKLFLYYQSPVQKLDYVQLSNQTWNETMHNVSGHKLQQYYQAQQVLSIVWTATVTWYTCHKQASMKILQNFWFVLVFCWV